MSDDASESPEAHSAGAFDIRNFIAALIGLYGVILVLVSFFDSDAEIAKAADVRINLWAGLGMLATAVAFVAWARLRPVVVPDKPAEQSDDAPGNGTDSSD